MFKPLTALGTVMRDPELSTIQKAILAAAIVSTDNKTRRVRASQQMVAALAGTNERSVRRALKEPVVERYFKITKTGRWVHLDWRMPGEDTGHGDQDTGQGDQDTGQGDQDTGHGDHPSASTSDQTSKKTSASNSASATEKKLRLRGKRSVEFSNTSLPGNEEPSSPAYSFSRNQYILLLFKGFAENVLTRRECERDMQWTFGGETLWTREWVVKFGARPSMAAEIFSMLSPEAKLEILNWAD